MSSEELGGLVMVKAAASALGDLFARIGNEKLALEMYEHSDTYPDALVRRAKCLRDLYYGDVGKELTRQLEERKTLPREQWTSTAMSEELIRKYREKVLAETGFLFSGFPDPFVAQRAPDNLIASIIKTAFRMAGGTLNRGPKS